MSISSEETFNTSYSSNKDTKGPKARGRENGLHHLSTPSSTSQWDSSSNSSLAQFVLIVICGLWRSLYVLDPRSWFQTRKIYYSQNAFGHCSGGLYLRTCRHGRMRVADHGHVEQLVAFKQRDFYFRLMRPDVSVCHGLCGNDRFSVDIRSA